MIEFLVNNKVFAIGILQTIFSRIYYSGFSIQLWLILPTNVRGFRSENIISILLRYKHCKEELRALIIPQFFYDTKRLVINDTPTYNRIPKSRIYKSRKLGPSAEAETNPRKRECRLYTYKLLLFVFSLSVNFWHCQCEDEEEIKSFGYTC